MPTNQFFGTTTTYNNGTNNVNNDSTNRQLKVLNVNNNGIIHIYIIYNIYKQNHARVVEDLRLQQQKVKTQQI